MTDRELLELAAKAAGYDISECSCKKSLVVKGSTPRSHNHWDPLSDSGDALRLAAVIGMSISIDTTDGETRIAGHKDWVTIIAVSHELGGALAATRRAIVRAAAAIGETMP